MERLTAKNESGYMLPAEQAAAAAERLGRMEDMQESILAEQQMLAAELDQLRSAGKTKTLRFREAMARKITLANMLDLFHQYGL